MPIAIPSQQSSVSIPRISNSIFDAIVAFTQSDFEPDTMLNTINKAVLAATMKEFTYKSGATFDVIERLTKLDNITRACSSFSKCNVSFARASASGTNDLTSTLIKKNIYEQHTFFKILSANMCDHTYNASVFSTSFKGMLEEVKFRDLPREREYIMRWRFNLIHQGRLYRRDAEVIQDRFEMVSRSLANTRTNLRMRRNFIIDVFRFLDDLKSRSCGSDGSRISLDGHSQCVLFTNPRNQYVLDEFTGQNSIRQITTIEQLNSVLAEFEKEIERLWNLLEAIRSVQKDLECVLDEMSFMSDFWEEAEKLAIDVGNNYIALSKGGSVNGMNLERMRDDWIKLEVNFQSYSQAIRSILKDGYF